MKLYKHMADEQEAHFFGPQPTAEDRKATYTARRLAQREAFEKQSVVYYVRIHDFIKIGFTGNVKQRMNALRVSPDAILATEPGGRELEADRHKQFADIRLSKREDFKPVPRLMAHIEAVREFHGEPTITGYASSRTATLSP